MHDCQYTNVFAIRCDQKYISRMSDKMREILNKLMSQHGDNPTSLSKKCGIPQPTIYRFLSGEIKDLKSTKKKQAMSPASRGFLLPVIHASPYPNTTCYTSRFSPGSSLWQKIIHKCIDTNYTQTYSSLHQLETH